MGLLEDKLSHLKKKGDEVFFPQSGRWFVKSWTSKRVTLECEDKRKLVFLFVGTSMVLAEKSANVARDLEGELIAELHSFTHFFKDPKRETESRR